MEIDFSTLGTTAISIVSTFLVIYVIAVVKLRKNLELKFDVELQNNRIEPYKKIWKILHSLKKIQNRGTTIKKSDCEQLLKDMRRWHHEENGGMWLSRKTMINGYQELKDVLKETKYVETTKDVDGIKHVEHTLPKKLRTKRRNWKKIQNLKNYFIKLVISELY